MVLNRKVEELTYSDVTVKELVTLLTTAQQGIVNLDSAIVRMELPGGITNTFNVKIETFKVGNPNITLIPTTPVDEEEPEKEQGKEAPKLSGADV